MGRELLRMFHLGQVRPDGYYPMETWDLNNPLPVQVILGACMFVRRSALDQAGLFDERFFMYSEEVDLCRRIRLAGWEIYYVPRAIITHYGGQSTQQMACRNVRPVISLQDRVLSQTPWIVSSWPVQTDLIPIWFAAVDPGAGWPF